ncbi:MAG: class I SAM-dependent methyltransferase, partial [Candidatus Heimdallarchaeota archaeon]
RAHWLEPDPFIVSLLPKFKKEEAGKVLDLGFGIGRHAILFAKNGFEVYGIDPSSSGLEFAMKWAERERIALNLITGDMNQLPFKSNFFDLIIAWNVIYHGTAEIIHKTINEIVRCLKINRYLLCTLISTKHTKYGMGKEIERDTFVISEETEKKHPHHYFNKDEIARYLKGFTHITCDDKEQFYPGLFHWYILTRLISKSEGR